MKTKELNKKQIEKLFPGLKPGMVIRHTRKNETFEAEIKRFFYNPNAGRFEMKLRDLKTGRKRFICDTSIGFETK